MICWAVLGDLAYGGAHAALAHPVGAAEVELEAVGSGVFGARDQCRARTRALDCDHEGRDNDVFGVAALDLGDLAEVGFDAGGPLMSSMLLKPIMRRPS